MEDYLLVLVEDVPKALPAKVDGFPRYSFGGGPSFNGGPFFGSFGGPLLGEGPLFGGAYFLDGVTFWVVPLFGGGSFSSDGPGQGSTMGTVACCHLSDSTDFIPGGRTMQPGGALAGVTTSLTIVL